MSCYSLSNSAPINNVGYYDAPIYNQYSNPQRNGPYRQITNGQMNHQIADTYNSGNDNYEIYQTQNYPSQNLFIASDAVNSGYGYTGNNGEYSGSIIHRPQNTRNNYYQNNSQNNSQNNVQYIENFENSDSEYDLEMNANRLDKAKNLRQNPVIRNEIANNYHQNNPQIIHNNQYIPRQPVINYNDYNYNNSPDYLNVGSIPNIAGLYNNMNKPQERIIIKEVNNDKETKITDLDSDDDDDDDDDEPKLKSKKETKLSNLKKKMEKKKKMKKKKNNMIYLVIFLLAIIIGLMLYIVMNYKVKRVRF